jgi:hypothetical protein
MNLKGRIATDVDIAELAAMNQQLIRDEGHRNSMSADELEGRMRKWLAGENSAAIFTVNGSTVGYALYKRQAEWTYLRHLRPSGEPDRLPQSFAGRNATRW